MMPTPEDVLAQALSEVFGWDLPARVEARQTLAALAAAGWTLSKSEPALDVDRLTRAMRWAGIRSDPDFATIEEAARQVAGDYASSMLDRVARQPVPPE